MGLRPWFLARLIAGKMVNANTWMFLRGVASGQDVADQDLRR